MVIGTKSGQLELYDLGSSSMLEAIDAHAGAVWAIDARPADRGGSGSRQIATGSADHDVKFWEVELKLDPEWSATQQRITLECARTLTMTEDVLAIKYSPDAKVRQRQSLRFLTDDIHPTKVSLRVPGCVCTAAAGGVAAGRDGQGVL